MESMLPMLEDVYVKEFILFEGESMQYYFEEVSEDDRVLSEKETVVCRKNLQSSGQYDRLNRMTFMSAEDQYEEMLGFKREEHVAKALFQTY